MLSVNPFANFKNSFINYAKFDFRKNQKQDNVFSNINSSLAPLAKDTISFGSSEKLNLTLMQAFDNIQACQTVAENANIAEANLKKALKDNFQNLIISDSNPDAPVKEIVTRIKSPDSIREKVANKLETQITADIPSAFNPKNPETIKTVLGDIVGARIVLAKSDRNNTKKVIAALKKAVQNGDLSIKSVKYITPPANKKGYFTEGELQNLVNISSTKRKQQGKSTTTYSSYSLDSGYMALHLIVDLSDPDLKVKNNNYTGEIQIVGYDVSRLKDVEDFCYKLKSGKDIKSGNPAYSPFSKYFNSFMEDSENWPTLAKDFTEYTRTAYRLQKEKPALVCDKKNKNRKREPYRLPTIAECGMGDRIPQGLDFNNLAKIKYHCDKIAECTKSELSV